MSCRIQILQCNPHVGDIQGNTERLIAAAQAASAQGVDLLLCPELVLTGYPPEDLLLRRDVIQAVEGALERVRAQVRDITLVLGYPRAAVGGLFNVAGVIRDGELIAEYAKQYLPNYSVFDEKRYFQAGRGAVVFEQSGLRLGLSICEDIWHEAPTRESVAAGAQVLLSLNASPFHAGKRAEREAVVCAHARAHGLTILYANLVGGQDELVFDGASFVVAPSGEVIQRAPEFRESTLTLDLDASGQPRPLDPAGLLEPLGEEAAIYEALVLGVRDYARKNGFEGAVLGLSGGIDSALTLAIAVDALGPEQVEAVLMPSRYTSEISIQDALAESQALGVKAHLIPIEPVFQGFLDLLAPVFAGRPADVTEENIQARCRGLILMALSNKFGKILLTTGNKSELAVGYATLYGDMAGGFAPLKDVPKTLVYRLARQRNARSPVIPERVFTRPPSAELRPDQTDQDSLPPYELLDAILKHYVEEDEGIAQIVARGYPPEVVKEVARLVDRNEYKRRQAPPGVRISRRAFGRDRRYPLTNGFRP